MKSLAIKIVTVAVLCASLSGCLIITETHHTGNEGGNGTSATSSASSSAKSF